VGAISSSDAPREVGSERRASPLGTGSSSSPRQKALAALEEVTSSNWSNLATRPENSEATDEEVPSIACQRHRRAQQMLLTRLAGGAAGAQVLVSAASTPSHVNLVPGVTLLTAPCALPELRKEVFPEVGSRPDSSPRSLITATPCGVGGVGEVAAAPPAVAAAADASSVLRQCGHRVVASEKTSPGALLENMTSAGGWQKVVKVMDDRPIVEKLFERQLVSKFPCLPSPPPPDGATMGQKGKLLEPVLAHCGPNTYLRDRQRRRPIRFRS